MKKTFVDLLARIPFFCNFGTDDLAIISNAMNLIEVDKGKILFSEGDRGDYICFIVDGRFEILKRTITKNDITIGTLSRGQSFGEMAIIENSPRLVTVKAGTKAKVAILARKDLHLITDDYPEIGMRIFKGICVMLNQKLHIASSRLADSLSKSL